MADNIRIPYSKNRMFPIFESDIKDDWSITQNDAVGAEDKSQSYSSYAPSGTTPTTSTDFDTDINLQIQSVVGDSLRFTSNGTIKHNQIQLPTDFKLETDVGSEVTIELESISCLYLDLDGIPGVSPGRHSVTLDNPLCGCPSVNGRDLCVGVAGHVVNIKKTNNMINHDGPDFKTWGVSENIFALDLDTRNNYIFGILSNSGNNDLAYDPSISTPAAPVITFQSSVADVSETSTTSKIRVVHVLDSAPAGNKSYVLVTKTGNTKNIIRYEYDLDDYTPGSGVLDEITAEFESGDASTIRRWEVFSKGNMGNTLPIEETSQPLIKAMILTTSYETYVYSSIEMDEADIIERLDRNLVTMVNFQDYKPIIGRVSFLGGRSIVKYDGRSFVTEYTFNIDRNSNVTGHFFYHYNNKGYVDTLYYVMTDDIKTIIVRRDDGGEWSEVFKSVERLLPIESSRNSQIFLSDVIFYNSGEGKLYMHIGENGGNICFGENSEVNGMIIKNNDPLNYISDITTYNSMNTSVFDYGFPSPATASPKISYCSIYDTIGKAGTYRIWNISNSIIKTEYECMVFSNDVSWDYTGNCERNILQSTQKWALYIKDSYDFTGADFLNNTISSLNGIYVNSDDNNPNIKNSIISATNFAIYNDNGISYLITYSLIYGRIQSLSNSYLTGTSIILNVNPLFKDQEGGNFYLQHVAEDYPMNSSAVGTADPSGDRGAYDMTYVNNGEINSKTIELFNFDSDMIMSWIYPNSESTHDYTGNLLKYTGLRRRFITLSQNLGSMSMKILYKLHSLFLKKTPLRFYPHGLSGMQRFAIKTSFTDLDTIAKLHTNKKYTETLSDELSLYLETGSFIYNEEEYELVLDIPYYKLNNISIVLPADSSPPYSNLPYIEVDTTSSSEVLDIEGTDITSSVVADPMLYFKIGQIIEGNDFQLNTKIYDIEIVSSGVYNIYIDKLPISTGAITSLDLYNYYFDDGYLRGFYVQIEHGGNTYYLRIDENTDYRLYLKNTSRESITVIDGFYNVKSPFIYVTINKPPEIREGLWLRDNQTADLTSVELTELEDKFEEQV